MIPVRLDGILFRALLITSLLVECSECHAVLQVHSLEAHVRWHEKVLLYASTEEGDGT